jgi:DNA-binding LacI/PurR family transcriptional regulator
LIFNLLFLICLNWPDGQGCGIITAFNAQQETDVKSKSETSDMAVANVKEIARGLSLSPGTVSKALNGSHGLVSVETARQVLEYCAQKGYMSRSEAGRALMKIKSRSSGAQLFAAMCRTGIGAYDEVFAGVCEQLQANNLFTSCFMIRDKISLKSFPYDRAETVILIGRVPRTIQDEFVSHDVPLVLVDDRVSSLRASCVNSNNLEAISHAVHILAELGHRRIAFMCRHEDKTGFTYTFHQRQVGYASGLASMGIAMDEKMLITCGASKGQPASAWDDVIIRDLVKLSEQIVNLSPRPTAVVCANDLMACVLIDTLKKHSIGVPEEISVIGYDGWNRLAPVSHCGFTAPSTMVVNWREMGREAAELALTIQFGSLQSPRCLEVPCEYEDHGTVAPPAM